MIGPVAWPHDRAVEVRDAIEAVARGHRDVVIVHGTRRDQRGRLRGVDAWAELTARRLGYTAEPHTTAADTVERLRSLRPTVVVAFGLEQRATRPGDSSGDAAPEPGPDPVETLAAAAEHAGVPVLVHRPNPTT